MPDRYRKKPIEIEAMQWTGTNAAELAEWTAAAFYEIDPDDRGENPDATGDLYVAANSVHLGVEPGEWIIQDARGFYPCKAEIFAATYELVEETPHA